MWPGLPLPTWRRTRENLIIDSSINSQTLSWAMSPSWRGCVSVLGKGLGQPVWQAAAGLGGSWELRVALCHSIQKYCCSIAKSCLTLCDPMDCSMLGFPVLLHLPDFAQVHVHWIGDAIQPSHPLSSSSPFAFNLSQHQGLFQWVNCLHQVTKVLEFSFSIIPSSEYSVVISSKIDWFDLLAA